MDSQWLTEVGPGKLFLDYGPISMVIAASRDGEPLTALCRDAGQIAVDCLTELGPQLKLLKRSWTQFEPGELSGVAVTMWQAVQATADNDLTPMAAVAGAFADKVADWLQQQGATKVLVNNGGDVAIRLLADETTKVGVMPEIGGEGFSKLVRLTSGDGIGGIATSGLGGRSFTCGVMESVTVLAKSCAVADAFATSLANASYIDSSAVVRGLARLIDPDTDIPDLMVTESVGRLTPQEVQQSMQQVLARLRDNVDKRIIKGATLHLQGANRSYPEALFSKMDVQVQCQQIRGK